MLPAENRAGVRVLAWVCFSFAAAALLGVYLGAGTYLTVMAVLSLTASVGLVFLRRFSLCRMAALALLGFGLGALYTSSYAQRNVTPFRAMEGSVQTASIQVTQPPEESTNGQELVGRTQIEGRTCKVLLYLHEASEFQIGDELTLIVQFAELSGNRGWERSCRAKGIQLVCYQKGSLIGIEKGGWSLRLLPQQVAQKCRQGIDDLFSSDAAKLIRALLTGDRSCLSSQTQSDFSRSGLSHTIAVSGMHVSILLALIFGLFGKRRLGLTLPWLLLPFFTAMVGFTPSAVRAAVMQLVLILAFISKQEYDLPTALGFALLLSLLQNPWAIASVSLQMSYLAVVGIYLFSRPCYEFLCGTKPKRQTRLRKLLWRLRRGVSLMAATTFGALVFTVPLTAAYFGTVCLVPFLTNLLVLSAVSICFCGGFLAVLLGMVWRPLGVILSPVAEWTAQYILFVAKTAAQWPAAAMSITNPYLLSWLALAYGLLALTVIGHLRRLTIPICAAACGLGLCVLLSFLDVSRDGCGITAVNVGQGQCIVLEFSDYTCMVDCGGSQDDTAGQRAADFLTERRIDQLDLLILTHYDRDHVGGVEQLLYRTRVRGILLPDVADGDGLRRQIEVLARRYEIPVIYVTSDLTIQGAGGSLRVFAPLSEESSNAGSLCVLAEGGVTALVTGDLDITTEYLLLHQLENVDLDILVAGHHGSGTSTSGALLERLRPEIVLISVGENNSYGHPAPAVLERINSAGAAAYRTDQCGTISIYQNEE